MRPRYAIIPAFRGCHATLAIDYPQDGSIFSPLTTLRTERLDDFSRNHLQVN
jgi:hypothetical protein